MADAPTPPPAEPTDYNPGAGAAPAAAQAGPTSALFGVAAEQSTAQVGSKHTVPGPKPVPQNRRAAEAASEAGTPQEQFETTSLADMAKSINGLKPDALKALQDRLFNAGFYGTTKLKDVSFGVADEATQDAWNQLLNRNARGVAAGNKSSWEETLSEALKGRGIDDPTGTNGQFESATSSSSGSKTASGSESSSDLSQSSGLAHSTTTTSSSDTKFSDPTTAHALIVKAMQDKLGRDPTDGELGTFRGALHAYEAANPTVSKVTEDQSRTTNEVTNTAGTKETADSSQTKGTQSQQTTSTAPGEKTPASTTANPWSGDLTQMMSQGATPGSPTTTATTTSNQTSTSGDATASQSTNTSSQGSNTVQSQGTAQSQNSTQSGGTNPADWAQFYVQEQNRPEMDEYHKATMYYNAALQALGISQGSL